MHNESGYRNTELTIIQGTGKATERAYFYRPPSAPSGLNITIDTTLSTGAIDHGVILGEGDGTVSLLSMGYMCNRGWHMKRYNPSGAKIVVREMAHEPDRFSPRGGPNTGDHVDILGRTSLNEMILRIAAGRGHEIGDDVSSRIREYAGKVKIWDEDEEMGKNEEEEEEEKAGSV
jgi:phospholipid:diacylglycerol acyltransferase